MPCGDRKEKDENELPYAFRHVYLAEIARIHSRQLTEVFGDYRWNLAMCRVYYQKPEATKLHAAVTDKLRVAGLRFADLILATRLAVGVSCLV